MRKCSLSDGRDVIENREKEAEKESQGRKIMVGKKSMAWGPHRKASERSAFKRKSGSVCWKKTRHGKLGAGAYCTGGEAVK